MSQGSYLYLVETETGKVLKRFPIDHFDRELDAHFYEVQLRQQYGVDDPETGVDLRDSRVRPE